MARTPRRRADSGIYHIMLRGINKQAIFEDDGDKHRFILTLKKYQEVSKYWIYAYCVMDNHVHILMKEREDDVSKAMKRISSSYVFWYNEKYERSGHLFQARFRSEPVESIDYFLTVLRYIHQNPLKARMARSVMESKWISYHEYLGKPAIVDIDYALDLFASNRKQAKKLFMEYMNEDNDDECLDYQENVGLTDDKVREHIYDLGIENISTLQQMNRVNRNKIIKQVKELEGVSLRQLSRITGISKSLIGSL